MTDASLILHLSWVFCDAHNATIMPSSIDDRVRILEERLQSTQDTLRVLVKKIEELHGMDIDHDGKIG